MFFNTSDMTQIVQDLQQTLCYTSSFVVNILIFQLNVLRLSSGRGKPAIFIDGGKTCHLLVLVQNLILILRNFLELALQIKDNAGFTKNYLQFSDKYLFSNPKESTLESGLVPRQRVTLRSSFRRRRVPCLQPLMSIFYRLLIQTGKH